jgi:hypothetical protein
MSIAEVGLAQTNASVPAAVLHPRGALVPLMGEYGERFAHFALRLGSRMAEHRREPADEDIGQLKKLAITFGLTSAATTVIRASVVEGNLLVNPRAGSERGNQIDYSAQINVSIQVLMVVKLEASDADFTALAREQVQSALEPDPERGFEASGLRRCRAEAFQSVAKLKYAQTCPDGFRQQFDFKGASLLAVVMRQSAPLSLCALRLRRRV